jgi:LPS sulfotransferase NodH
LKYDDLNKLANYGALAEMLNGLHEDFITVEAVINKLTFTTVGVGSVDGALTYALDNNDASTPAILTSGDFGGTYAQMLEAMGGKDFAISTTINALAGHSTKWKKYFQMKGVKPGDSTSVTLYRDNQSCQADGNYSTFLSILKPTPWNNTESRMSP